MSGRVARVGVYDYMARELGLTDRAPNDVVKVYRDPLEVFKDASLSTYDNVDVTNNHPTELVTADTYKNVTSGIVTSTGRQDGEYVVVDMIVKDANTIRDIEAGKVELSPGYTAIYDEAPDGADYDFVQRDITINHVAIVPLGRGGQAVRLFDQNGEIPMTVKVTLDQGVIVEVADEATKTLITKTLTDARQAVTDAVAKADKAQAVADAKVEELDKLKQSTSDEAISTRITAVFDAHKGALKIAGKDFTCDAKSPVEIQRAALAKVRDKVDWTSKSADYVQAAFDMEAEKKEVEDEEDEEADKAKKKIAEDAAHKSTNDGKPLLAGHEHQRNMLFGGK